MQYAIGIIFMFTLVNISISLFLREVDFMKELFPDQNFPKPLFLSVVKRRAARINAFYANKTLSNTTRTFVMSTSQSMTLLIEILSRDDANDCSNTNDTIAFYEQTVHKLNEIYEYLNIASDDRYNINTVYTLDVYNLAKDELVNMIDVYIDDIELVRFYEEEHGDPARVNINIFRRLNTLSSDIRNLFHDDKWKLDTNKTIGYKAIDQCILRLEILLKTFKRDYIDFCG